MGTKSPYEILGISPNASQKEIVRAYRLLAVKYHPDKRIDDGKFRIIKEAYESIKDSKPKTGFTPTIGKDLRISIRATIKDVAECKTVTINYLRKILCKKCEKVTCTVCGGTGRNPVSLIMGPLKSCKACAGSGRKSKSGCHTCKGTGFVEEKASTNITLTPIMTGPMTIRGKGNEGEHGLGNLIIEVFIDKDKTYQVSGLNLKRNLEISPAQSVIGGTIQLDVLGRSIDLIIPSGVQDGQMIKKDMAGLNYQERTGDLCVTVLIKSPRIVSQQERSLYLEILNIEKETLCRSL